MNIEFKMSSKRNIAIIGVGPRGSWALENLVLELHKKNKLLQTHILLYEKTGNWGNGQVYNLQQPDTNWININERILHLDAREKMSIGNICIDDFPSYHQWTNKQFPYSSKKQIDTYPPRSHIGNYLQQRFNTLVRPLQEAQIVSLHTEKVDDLILEGKKITLKTNADIYCDIDEALLTIGHQPTKLSKQLLKWKEYDSNTPYTRLFESPYPIQQLLECEKLTTQSSIGIRGFGLAMIDIVRGIAEKFGDFSVEDEPTQPLKYKTTFDLSNFLVPFSLDGLPMSPKPLNAEIDKWFEPTTEQIKALEQSIGDKSIQKAAKSPQFLIDAITPIVANIYLQLPKQFLQHIVSTEEIKDIAQKWLENDEYQHPTIVARQQSAEKTMREFVEMATGQNNISLDYCIGQVWRYCQPSIYDKLSFNNCSDEVFADIIKLDERMKRYAYGPPVESIQQLLALISAKVMTLDVVNNPDIDLTSEGWVLKSNGKKITTSIMINSVLASPNIAEVDSSLIKKLLINDILQPIHDDLGISTDDNGYVISEKKQEFIPIALLGRLAKGTIIGVDAILECFGERPRKWAIEAANHHQKGE